MTNKEIKTALKLVKIGIDNNKIKLIKGDLTKFEIKDNELHFVESSLLVNNCDLLNSVTVNEQGELIATLKETKKSYINFEPKKALTEICYKRGEKAIYERLRQDKIIIIHYLENLRLIKVDDTLNEDLTKTFKGSITASFKKYDDRSELLVSTGYSSLVATFPKNTILTVDLCKKALSEEVERLQKLIEEKEAEIDNLHETIKELDKIVKRVSKELKGKEYFYKNYVLSEIM